MKASPVMMLILVTVACWHPSAGQAQVKAFPSAEGFGANAVGGRGGAVIKVTNLNDAGPGSLRNCMENTGPRTCVFAVGGTITLTSPILVYGASMSYLTVAGQTAPGDGIQIKGHGLKIEAGVHDIILRHLRIRSGPGAALYQQGWNILVYEAGGGAPYNIMLDHLSLSWAPYIEVEFSGVQQWTVQWSLLAVGLNPLDYVDPLGNPGLAMGLVSGSYSMFNETGTMHHNILWSHEARQPLIGQGLPIDMVNNIMANWYACTYGTRLREINPEIKGNQVNVNLVNNIWRFGPAQTGCVLGTIDGDGSAGDPFPQVYITGNQTPFCGGPACSNPTLGQMGFVGADAFGNPPISDANFRTFTRHAAPAVTTTPTPQLQATLVPNVGATKPARDALDTKYLQQFQAGQGNCGEQPGRVGCRQGEPYPVLTGGPSPLDSDGDGIPDSWEMAHGLNPNNPADGAQTAANGYTNLENYLNELAGDVGSAGPPAAPSHLRVITGTP